MWEFIQQGTPKCMTSISMDVKHWTRLSIRHSTLMKSLATPDPKLNKVPTQSQQRINSWSKTPKMDHRKDLEMVYTRQVDKESDNLNQIQNLSMTRHPRVRMTCRILLLNHQLKQEPLIHRIGVVVQMPTIFKVCKRETHWLSIQHRPHHQQQMQWPIRTIALKIRLVHQNCKSRQARHNNHRMDNQVRSSQQRWWSLGMTSWLSMWQDW